MTKIEQARFVRDLVGSVSKELIEKVSEVPEDWDGIELRQWIADRFEEACVVKMAKGRLKHYRNDVLVHNL